MICSEGERVAAIVTVSLCNRIVGIDRRIESERIQNIIRQSRQTLTMSLQKTQN